MHLRKTHFSSIKLPLAVLICCVCIACNYKLFVHKKKIVQEQNGYLVFYYSDTYQDIAFFPSKDTVDKRFLSQSHVNDYRIWDENVRNEIMYLKERAFNYAFQRTNYKSETAISVDTLYLIPVTVRYYLGDLLYFNQHGPQHSSILYEFDKKGHELRYNVDDYRNVLLVSVLRDSDRKWLSQNYQRFIQSR